LLRSDPSGLKTWFLLGAGQDGANGVYKGIFEGADETEKDNVSFVKEDWRRMGLGSFGNTWKPTAIVDSSDWRAWAHKVGGEICAAKHENAEEPIRIIGYSRGAALALVVAKFLQKCGCDGSVPNWKATCGPHFGNEYPCATKNCPKSTRPLINFMGLVDAVSSSAKWISRKDPYVPNEVPTNVMKAVVYKGTSWTLDENAAMKFHDVQITPPRVTERRYGRKHAGVQDDSNSMGARDASDVLKDLAADYE
jgi:hypothetical protein